jgi:hypothetical protein
MGSGVGGSLLVNRLQGLPRGILNPDFFASRVMMA